MFDKKEYQKQYQKNNPEKIKKWTKKWRENNPEYDKQHSKQYRKENKEKESIRSKKYYQGNKENILKQHNKRREEYPEYLKQWKEKNPEYSKKHSSEYYQKNREKILEYSLAYSKTEKGRITDQKKRFKRRVNEKNILNTLTSQEWLDILEQYNYRCTYCDMEFDCENLPTKDHIIPISKGGNNTKENIVPACRSCNSKKYNKILVETLRE